MKIEPVSQDPSVEERREKEYYDNVIGYLKFWIDEYDRKIQAAYRSGDEADRMIAKANRSRYESGGKYDPFDQNLIRASSRLSQKRDTIIDSDGRIKKYIELMEEPYFGRIDYGASDDTIAHYYVGRADIPDYVLDWRNSKAGEMYSNADKYVAEDDVFVALKREVKTWGGRYRGYTDLINQYHRVGLWHKQGGAGLETGRAVGTISADEHLVRLLEEYRSKKQVHDIIKSIQQNQYRIISEKPERNILVNGCAGSGKTMVMYHRLSYLGYNYPDLMKAERIYTIAPSSMFVEDMKPLLHRLELDDIFNGTFVQLLDQIILRYQRKYGVINPYLFLPYSQSTAGSNGDINSTLRDLADTIARSEKKNYLLLCMEHAHSLLKERGFKDFSDCKHEHDFYNRVAENYRDTRFARKLSPEQNILLSPNDPRRFYGKEVFANNTFADVETVIDRQFEEGSNKKRYKILSNHYRLFQEMFNSQPKKSDKGTVTDLWGIFDNETVIADLAMLIHVEALVRGVWRCYREERAGIENRNLSLYELYFAAHPAKGDNAFSNNTVEKVAVLKYLADRFGALSTEKTFFFIDEFQNFHPSHLAALKSVFPNAILNLYGDFDQRISPHGVNSMEELAPIGEVAAFAIKENYRNAAEITRYINDKLHKDMMPIGLSGSVTEVSSEQCEYKKDGRTVVIFQSKKLLRKFHSQCTNPKNFEFVTDKIQKTSGDKILLLSVGQAKGLEFETVYVHPEGMTDNEKYVAFTRALVNLIVVTPSAGSSTEESKGTSSQAVIQTEKTPGNTEVTKVAQAIKRLLTQYNELCISHRAEEEQLMKQIIELQNTMLDNNEGCSGNNLS